MEKLTQEQIAEGMKTSRGTVWRLLESAREKVALALTESRPLLISPKGEVKKKFKDRRLHYEPEKYANVDQYVYRFYKINFTSSV